MTDSDVDPDRRSDQEQPPPPIDRIEIEGLRPFVERYEADQREVRRRERKRYRLEALTFAAVIIYSTITALQWYQALRANRLTEGAVRAARDAATAGTHQVTELKESNRLTRENAERAQQSANEALLLTRQLNENDGRARVLVKGFGGVAVIPNRTAEFTAVIQNYGKAPAEGIVITAFGQILESLPEKILIGHWPANREIKPVIGSGVLPPGESAKHPFRIGPFTEDEVRALVQDKKRLVVTGAVLYLDYFRTDRKTTFCATVDQQGRFGWCDRFNNVY